RKCLMSGVCSFSRSRCSWDSTPRVPEVLQPRLLLGSKSCRDPSAVKRCLWPHPIMFFRSSNQQCQRQEGQAGTQVFERVSTDNPAQRVNRPVQELKYLCGNVSGQGDDECSGGVKRSTGARRKKQQQRRRADHGQALIEAVPAQIALTMFFANRPVQNR